MARCFEPLGMQCIPCPFKHINSIRGSFHCATTDLVRDDWDELGGKVSFEGSNGK
ncbi:hypothetical protein P170DRAFT_435543 [Aspergillus steynii IBT 23096]|uniref:Uncharacterized protein n=1 Tax=Aspergillus steynii IBT 23096 TaxID=1392250 RepID=A0A2I2GBU0_9EURO|nr:uncharacterized protein P170DRAFT_435543 [Aspergillus steynii IBT 23096]PLB50348.1 hypothetical protein P170DRAFT_435543 [Aspergillus steynii IBT 23096]